MVLEAHANALTLHETNDGLMTTLIHEIPNMDAWPVQYQYKLIPPAL